MIVPLKVAGRIEARIADEVLLVTARDDTIVVEAPGLRSALAALRGTGGRAQRAGSMAQAATALQSTDLRVLIRLAGGTVAVLGAGTRPGLLSRLLGVAPLEVRPGGLMSLGIALWRAAFRLG